jgi:DNA (cytosine-5)-methyltransferase 1
MALDRRQESGQEVEHEILKALSLFSGIGGFDLALNRLGVEIIGACEIDEYARQIYHRHFPTVPIHEDATKLNPDDLPSFDILVAGFPCQSFSYAGQRRGLDDTRGSLFFEIIRIAKAKRPDYLILENVTGLLSNDEGRTFETMLKALDEIGYDAEWNVYNSSNYTPQERERVIIKANLRKNCDEIQIECTYKGQHQTKNTG